MHSMNDRLRERQTDKHILFYLLNDSWRKTDKHVGFHCCSWLPVHSDETYSAVYGHGHAKEKRDQQ